MTSIRQKPVLLLLLRVFSILAGAAALVCGAQALSRERLVFASPPRTQLRPQFRAQVRTVAQRLPPGAFVLHLSSSPEYWYSRLWQRVLYPRNETIVIQPPWGPERLREMRSKYGARFAITAGDPPVDPGFLWRIDLGRLTGVPGETWFGELGP